MTRSWPWNAASLVGACILLIAAIFSGTLLNENEGAHPQPVPRSSRSSLPRGDEHRSLWRFRSPFHDPRTVDIKDAQIGGVQGLGLYSFPTKTSERPTTTRPETFKVVILTMNRLASLKRLVDSLSHPDCAYGGFGMGVDLIFHVDRPKTGKDTAAWMETVRWTVEDVTWPHGSISTLVANENMGLRKAWLEAWHPESDDDRAIILEDDVTVSPLWYRWVNGAYDAYGHDGGRIAGFSLQRQHLVSLISKRTSVRVPTNDNEPFLYSLIGSIGFAPNARVWRNFLDWAECAIDNDVDVSINGLISTVWYKTLDKRGIWTQHFRYYMNRLGLGCLYHFPKDASKALGVHWREKGEHFRRSEGASHDVVTDPGEISNLVFPHDLNSYDFGAALIKPWSRPATLVVAAAVGYSADVFEIFVGTLRQHYDGDALLIVAKDPPPEILSIP
ncbi:hypothetical protein THAOC_22215 [Thalassiosira oceanica]|uniref:Glycosyl transferase 64 domain-containing protein n=1 Tax=Thalassiosira oceanica TaxID=159749 RepID=K0S9X1_THAOC|nr:hypothetical protein THAOC_22215 [Thalassiosira oceanica]|eukprot:EJK57711.1 hypothetical protein THAOC_22215 [Thalassiosira oceanica]